MAKLTGNPPISNVEDGVHVVTLVSISDPKVITPKTGVNAGKEMEIHEWVFALEDGTDIEASTSAFLGPKSKMYLWLSALNNGKAPYPWPWDPNIDFDTDDFNGRQALATIQTNEGGWPKVLQLTAMPLAMQQAAFGAATGAPTQAPAANVTPLRRPAAAPAADVPAQAPAAAARAARTKPAAEAPASEAGLDELPF